MQSITYTILLCLLVPFIDAQWDGIWDPLQWVDPLIGSTAGGNVFAGASVPYGMAKPVADTDDESNQGGFVFSNSSVTGFSQLHDSGTGGSPSLGNFALFPHPACPGDDLNRCMFPKKQRKVAYLNDSVVAEPGYFSIGIANGVRVDMTAAHRVSLFRFKFPVSPEGSPLILMDLTDLSDSRMDNGTIEIDEKTGRMIGGALFRSSFSTGTYNAYFCADFSGATIRDTGIFVNSRTSTIRKFLKISRGINGYPLPGGAFIRFAPGRNTTIHARVGLSFISSKQACTNAEAETWHFSAVKENAQKQWREKLSPVRIDPTGVDPSLVKILYSGIYRTMINPQDYTGENPLWKSSEPYFDSFYCLWDSFRSQIPFLILLDPEAVSRMIRSLIDTQKHEGWLPDCRMSFSKGYTQGGSNADVVLVDAFFKGIKDGIEWNEGYRAVKRDADEEPYDWCCHGRGGLESWHKLGYIPVEDSDFDGFGTMTRSVSRTLEYSYNDFVIGKLANTLEYRTDSAVYLERSQNWLNLFNPDTPAILNGVNTGIKGFFQPKYQNNTWGYQDPFYCSQLQQNAYSACSLQNNAAETFESSLFEYSFYTPHDMATLMKLYGGPDTFVKRLNYLHERNVGDISNEPSFLTVFQYHYAGRPAASARRSHYYVPSRFSARHDGLPGNDDSGAMGSFVAFNMLGFFPNPGQDVYFLIPPYFREIRFSHPQTNATATIRVENFDPTYKAIYIQNATLNGVPYTRNWITHSFFRRGGELVLTVGARESAWGTRVEDVPPSLSEYPKFDFNASAALGAGTYGVEVSTPPRTKPKGAEGHHVTQGGGGTSKVVRRSGKVEVDMVG